MKKPIMQLQLAERHELLQIAKQIYDLWSAGLSKISHRKLILNTCYQPWPKRNTQRLVYKEDEQVVCSCKVVHLPLLRKGKLYKVMGLGAIFTPPEQRGKGLASALIQAVIEKAQTEKYDAVFLFSDIKQAFYNSFGFRSLGNLDIEIDLGVGDQVNNATRDIEELEIEPSNSPLLVQEDLGNIIRCHGRWLARQPYGIPRTEDYFVFQLAKSIYLAQFSKQGRPKAEISVLRSGSAIDAYAITECGSTSMRILEITGSDAGRSRLWQYLIEKAWKKELRKIRGFESLAKDFMPMNNLHYELFKIKPMIKASQIDGYERDWGQPMYLALNNELKNLSNYNPCPLLEFDYF